MEEQEAEKEGLFERINTYIQLRTRLAILSTAEKAAEIYAKLLSNLIVLLCLVIAFLFGSLALAFYLSEVLENSGGGFLCVGGLYLLLAILVLIIRKKSIEKPLMDSAVRKFFSDKTEEDYGK